MYMSSMGVPFYYLSRHMGKPTICICENKGADQLRSDCKADHAFVFATRIVQFLFYLKPKFQASSSFLCLYRPVCGGPVRKPLCWFFPRGGSFISYLWISADEFRISKNEFWIPKNDFRISINAFKNILKNIYGYPKFILNFEVLRYQLRNYGYIQKFKV